MPKAVNQRLADEAVKHRLYLARYGTGTARKMQVAMKKAELEISVQLFRALEQVQPTAMNWNQQHLAKIKRSIQKTVFSVYEQVFGQLNADLKELVEYEAKYQAANLVAAIPVEAQPFVNIQSTTWSQVWAAANATPFQGALLKEWADRLPTSLVNKIGNAVQQGVLLGESYTDIIKRVKGSKENNYADGVVGRQRNGDLANLVKTAVNHVTAEAREETARVNEDIIKAREWLSTLDTHTSPMCIIRDRLLYTAGKSPKPIGHAVPYGAGPGRLHFCCRSTETWVIKSWDELGIPMKELSPGTRASMNGQVPSDMTYSKWLARQPYSTIEQVVGVTRAQLIREGKVDVPELFSDKGEWLTLKQLSDLDRITNS